MELQLDDDARDLIGEAGFDPVYGARPLKRAIQQQIENPLAQRILRGEFTPGDRIRVSGARRPAVFDKVGLTENRAANRSTDLQLKRHAVLRIRMQTASSTPR